MLDVGKLIHEVICQRSLDSFSSMLDVGKLIRRSGTLKHSIRFSSMLDVGKLIRDILQYPYTYWF